VKVSIFSENRYPDWKPDEKKFSKIAEKILKFYLADAEVLKKSCLNGFELVMVPSRTLPSLREVITTKQSHSSDDDGIASSLNAPRNDGSVQEEINKISFDILYCDSAKTLEINKEYRNKDYPADIITFAIFADSSEKFVLDGEINLGEIIIALDKVTEEAANKGVSPEEELSFLISHGILHLLGFDHETEEDYNYIIGLQNLVIEDLGNE